MQVKLVALALLTFACSAATPPVTTELLEPTTSKPSPTLATASTAPFSARFPGGPRLWRVDPATLAKIEVIGEQSPGWSIEPLAASDGELAFVGSNTAKWVLWLLDRPSSRLTAIAEGTRSWPIDIRIGPTSVEWLTAGYRGGIPEFPDGFTVRSFDRRTHRVSTIRELSAPDFNYGSFNWSEGLSVFGSSPRDGAPRVLVFDQSADSEPVLDLSLETSPEVLGLHDVFGGGSTDPAWDATRNLLFVPHLYDSYVTTIDLSTGVIATSQVIEATSFLDRLVAAWQPKALAKGTASFARATLSPDGSSLYVTGRVVDWTEDPHITPYREIPSGIVAVDSMTMNEVARTDLPIDQIAVSPSGETLLAAGSWYDSVAGAANSSGLYLLDAKTLEPLMSPDPTGAAPFYQFAFSVDGRFAYATEGEILPNHPEIFIRKYPCSDPHH